MVKIKLSRASARRDFCSVKTDSYFSVVKLVVLVHRVSTRHDKPTTAPILADEQKHFCCQRRENVLFRWFRLELSVTHQRTVKIEKPPITVNECNHRTLPLRENQLLSLSQSGDTYWFVFDDANVMHDGRGGESVVKSRGLSPRPSSMCLLCYFNSKFLT
ncbi:hypothetical protein Thini_4518 [Thiothrix nivea DSM 5205]|uniref:Uncharacterized protein n=1 Tax=Thiothrix nivea (strain ATCC 35100 / DSM 5205 / JP2) TaxID=870187 RepID=A0A656HNR0_THINJ|nr:hypothetical protein Thini_4518 [Thiothrix nivea DSM 5205]